MKLYFSIFTLLFCTTFTTAQYISGVTVPDTTQNKVTDMSDPSVMLAESITADDMRMHLTFLASDEFGGRELGTPGNEMTEDYLATYLAYLDVPTLEKTGNYFQPVGFTFSNWKSNELFVGDTRFKHLWDYLSFPNDNKSMMIENEDVVFLGYGIESNLYNDYKNMNLEGKTIIINKGTPAKEDGSAWLKNPEQWDLQKKLETAAKHGVKLVLVIEDDIKAMLAQNRRKLLGNSIQLGVFKDEDVKVPNTVFVSTNIAKELFGSKADDVIKARAHVAKKGQAQPVMLNTKLNYDMSKNTKILEGNNVLAFFPGSDPVLKDEIVVVTAHLDHLGQRGDAIYNGADDNGSGTTAVLEIAEALSMAEEKGLTQKRSVLVMWVNGEEKGLLGSDYYVENPVFPLEQTIVNVNVDMVGRVDKKYQTNPEYIYVIGSDRLSSDLHRINEDVNQKYTQLTLDYTYNDEADPNRYYYRSDHYNFAKKGVPAIFFFNGTHDDYHQVTDTVEKIEFDKMALVGKHIFHLIWDLANRADRIVVDGEVKD